MVIVRLEAGRQRLRCQLAELGDADETEQARRAFLDRAARTAASAFARALVTADLPADVLAAGVGNTRRTEVAYRIFLANHAPRVAMVSVQDQHPLRRREDITIRDEQASLTPDGRTDLGVLTWKIELGPGSSRNIDFSFRLDCPRGVDLLG
ncbi:DUF4139 domain-containing protein [Frankia sp. Cppng1_Ct_nod]|uniref:DUF4139 domain-containing protein n=1 Tax=Frankia sp. Cppng1_Ct_nod TaxID=2897162 RepID=UPI002024423E|nr:DUF4139 domain-containing protein [Frankia sp. Cppng1_Ct_nod]